jgi:hypothetical protein
MATISASVTKAMLVLAESRGLSSRALLQRAGLTETNLDDPDARVSVETNNALWAMMANALRDEAIGLEYALRRPSVELVGLAGIIAQCYRRPHTHPRRNAAR